ncbi:hypothetical protein EJ06DRAFT_553381 [Trichodelitschia bisporula]|uniref:Uncharacterized protein n=1 Tax=Trichodelitschia bisporula TaxID=703511 RepID=A0A6G1I904_9PEZI|nr:hypothetical protein EJ06DRAFT_553381 [Trichodelitschia bisporula]
MMMMLARFIVRKWLILSAGNLEIPVRINRERLRTIIWYLETFTWGATMFKGTIFSWTLLRRFSFFGELIPSVAMGSSAWEMIALFLPLALMLMPLAFNMTHSVRSCERVDCTICTPTAAESDAAFEFGT